jgi:hypothetical protein
MIPFPQQLSMFIAALDQTIVATAVPTIASDLVSFFPTLMLIIR